MHAWQVTLMEGLAGQLRYPLRALFADAAVTLHGTGAVTDGPWLNAGARDLPPKAPAADSGPTTTGNTATFLPRHAAMHPRKCSQT